MRVARAVLFAAVAVLVVSPAVAAKKKADPCIKDKVLASFQMRMLQTELVVGALSCKLTPRYNEFVTSYRDELMGAHRVLMRHFGREMRLEDYKSKTANEASQRSLANITEFCLYTSALYDKLLGPERPKLASFVGGEPVASRHGQNACGAPSLVTASSSGKVVPMPRQKPEVEGAAAVVIPASMPTPAPKPEIAADTSSAPTTVQQ
jgi:hypothetical protein